MKLKTVNPRTQNKLPIKGFIPVTLLDWPGKLACMIFVGNCNFCCPFCYNIDLVLRPNQLPDVSEEKVFTHLEKKRRWLDGIVISGGEPTLYPKELIDFCQKVKKLGFKIQIQTNGTNPDTLKELIEKKLVDYLAMDIKGPLEKYDEIVKTKAEKEKIQKSMDLIKNAKIEKEFRTTIVPHLLDEKDIEAIGKWLGPGCKVPYYLQQYRNEKTLNPKFKKTKPYPKEKLEEMKKIAQKYFTKVEIRGI